MALFWISNRNQTVNYYNSFIKINFSIWIIFLLFRKTFLFCFRYSVLVKNLPRWSIISEFCVSSCYWPYFGIRSQPCAIRDPRVNQKQFRRFQVFSSSLGFFWQGWGFSHSLGDILKRYKISVNTFLSTSLFSNSKIPLRSP